jgi:outer membrane protein
VPIFNGYQARTGVILSRLNEANEKLSMDLVNNRLSFEVQQAYQEVTLAGRRVEAIQVQLGALNEAFQYAEIQFNAGTIPFVSYVETLNNRTAAELQLLQARFDYLFRAKLLDVYLGKEIKF